MSAAYAVCRSCAPDTSGRRFQLYSDALQSSPDKVDIRLTGATLQQVLLEKSRQIDGKNQAAA
jgi:hypothetical protein